MLGKRIINSNDATGGACTTDTNDYPITNLAYYKMSSAADEKDTYNGTATDVNFNVQGKFGNAGEFNGTSSYISTGINVSTTLMTSRSYSFWFQQNSSTGKSRIFGGVNGSATNNGMLRIREDDEGLNYYSINNTIYTFTTTLTNDVWTHIALTDDGTTAKLYVNGSEITSPSTASYTSTTNTNLQIGRGMLNDGSVGDYTNGLIDQVRIFNSALSATQVASLYNEVYCVPTIVPTNNFNTVLYTGNGGTQAITGLGFQPDFVWIKQRTLTESHSLFDTVRGVDLFLRSDTTAAENNFGGTYGVNSFDSNGFTVGNGSAVNGNGYSMVGWSWKAGGAEVSNTDGTITSQVSANVDAGFSIVKYTGNVSQTGTVGHGLDVAPNAIFVKNIDNAYNWVCYFSELGASDYLSLNQTYGISGSDSRMWNNTSPTSSVFTASNGNFVPVNENGSNFVAYCFHSVDGFSKIGSYVGNGSATGPIITLGFEPAFVMVKNTTGTGLWLMSDNKRQIAATKTTYLQAQSSDAEYSPYTWIEYLSNGFQLKNTGSSLNTNGSTYIFMAFAEEVFVPDNFFNDDSTVATYKLNGDAGDDSGNGYNGTASNVTYAAGKFDEAAVFNGSSSYISLPPGVRQNNNFTASLWFNTNTISAAMNLIAFRNGRKFQVQLNGAVGNGGIRVNAGNNTTVDSASGIVTVNNWNHLAVVQSSTTGLTVYLNNSIISSNSGATGDLVAVTGVDLIGSYEGTLNFMDGSIDQVRIFNRALDSGEVTALYNE